MQIAVIGGGVSGFGSAIQIKEAFPSFEVTVITKDVTPNTTGDGSAGYWSPYILGNTPVEKVIKWGQTTHDFFYELWREGLAGACLVPTLQVTAGPPEKIPEWKHVVYGFQELTPEEIQRWNKTFITEYKSGYHYITFTCEPKILLPYLMDRFKKAGGNVVMQEVKSIKDFAESEYDAIINCTGLASRYIVPDEKVYPTRGQVARANTPWMYYVQFCDKNYIIPNKYTTVLGGTGQADDYNLNISIEDRKSIMEGCQKMVPGVKNAEVLTEWVGLRPSRKDSVRVERADVETKNGKTVIVIHNYGHGGSGVTLFWGCAVDVLDILKNALNGKAKSKL